MLYPGHVVMDDELAMLARVHKAICQEREISLEGARGQKIAAHLFKMFLNGLIEEDELLHAMRNRGLLVQPNQVVQHPLPT